MNMQDLAAEYIYDLQKGSYEGSKITISFRIYPDTKERLDYIAKAIEKAPGTVAGDIVTHAVDQLAWQLAKNALGGSDGKFMKGYAAIGHREFKEVTGLDSSEAESSLSEVMEKEHGARRARKVS